MSIQVALNHHKIYTFEHSVILGPHILRLRPIPHCRTPIKSYALKIIPENHTINWRKDVNSNWIGKLNFPEPTDIFKIEVDLVAELKPINPFDFLIDPYAAEYPFAYTKELAQELQAYLPIQERGSLLTQWMAQLDKSPQFTTSLILGINQKLHEEITYSVRLETGIQSCEETLQKKIGSCRDTAWLLVQIFRHLGLAARFVSGYLIQLAADEPPVDGPAGPSTDIADLHAWAEVYLPGAGWIGLDPTSGMLAAEGHIPLACAATPEMAAPITGTIEPCENQLDFSIAVSRIEETPRMTKPYTESQWQEIYQLGEVVEQQLKAENVGLTMGGEPTFISIDDYQSVEWRVGALGTEKRRLAGLLLNRLRDRFSTGSLLYYGMGKWYPGEALPRWALGCYWRVDRVPIWRNFDLLAKDDIDYGYTIKDAEKFTHHLVKNLGVSPQSITPAYDADARIQAYILPLLWAEQNGDRQWVACPWVVADDRLDLIWGDSPGGFRLPLDDITWADETDLLWEAAIDSEAQNNVETRNFASLQDIFARVAARSSRQKFAEPAKPNSIKVALSVEVRQGTLYIFIPPITVAENYLDLIASVEATAAQLQLKVRIEGYSPPSDRRLQGFQITPDPGVIEVNIHPASNWSELVNITNTLYAEAKLNRLGTEKYTLDGRTVSTGGGSHITIGGATVSESPLLRRPDLLQSLITFWQNHPSLSYLFSGEFVGPTSQSPRVDEARHDTLYELEIAFQQLEHSANIEPWLVDRLLRNLLIDISGNTHRSAFCIDKLYPVENPKLQLGLLEFRSVTMSPHPQMSLAIALLIRALVAKFWQQPYKNPLIRWGTMLHDKFLLPHYIAADFQDAIGHLQQAGYPFKLDWYEPFFEFRFPRYGEIIRDGIKLELRHALELWPVLGEEVNNGRTARYVDSSMERAQVLLTGATPGRHIVTCNGYPVPLQPTGVQGEYVAGVRYRARKVAASLHPAIDPHVPLVFDIVDTWVERSLGGCMLYATDPSGAEWNTFPINVREAQGRLTHRFVPHGHTPGKIKVSPVKVSPEFPCNLDLRRVN